MTTNFRATLQSSLGDAYTVEREIGGGGMSRVYVAQDVALRRRIVVKLLAPELAAEVSHARFQREITLAARLQHPHIVPLLSSGEAQGLPYYTMPFVDGESLRERLDRGGKMPVVEVVRLLREIATALAYAHDNGVVHRDIKPANILLSGGIALVADFGVARAVSASSTATHGSLTSTGIAIGTPAYMSPEQVIGSSDVDHRADLYSLGMLAYEMLAGEAPFAGRSAQALLAAHVIDTPEPLANRCPDASPALVALVMRCLEKLPANRPQRAKEIVEALDALATPSRGVVWSRQAWPRVSRAKLGAVAIVLIAAAGATWFAFNHRARGAAADSRLLVAPFVNLTGNPAFDIVGRIAADQLAATVIQAGTIEVVSSEIVLTALRDTTRPPAEQIQRLAGAAHARFLVTGTVVLRGDSLELRGQLTETPTGKVLAGFDPVMSPTSDPIVALNALGDHLLGALGMRAMVWLPQHGFRAPSFAAYQEFAKGMELFVVKGDFKNAIPFLKQAISLDSTFTRAYLALEQLHINLGQIEQADSVMKRVEQRSQGMTEGERLHLAFHKTQMTNDFPAALQALRRLAAFDSSTLWLELTGDMANQLLRPDIAVPALESSRAVFAMIGPFTRRENFGLLLEAFHQAGVHDRELRLAIDMPAEYPDLGSARVPKLRAYAGLARAKAAVALADTMLRESRDSSGNILSSVGAGAMEFRAHGDTATASRLLAMARDWMVVHAARSPSGLRQFFEGIILLESGMPDSAAVRLAQAAVSLPFLDAVGFLALAQAARGDAARARVIADSIGAIKGSRGIFGLNLLWQAAILGSLGDRPAAMNALLLAKSQGQGMARWHYDFRLQSLHGYPPFEELIRPRR